MKKFLMMLAVLFWVSAHAASPISVTYKVEWGSGHTAEVVAPTGQPATFSNWREGAKAQCVFAWNNSARSMLSFEAKAGVTATLVSDDVSESGVMALIVIAESMYEAGDSYALKSADCVVPNGSLVTTTVQSVRRIGWGERAAITLPNQHVVYVTPMKKL